MLHGGVGFSGVFNIQAWEDDRLVKEVTCPNQILRRGLLGIVRYGLPPARFKIFTVGSNAQPVHPSDPGVYNSLGFKEGTPVALPSPQWGFVATFQPGEGTGDWREIGMHYPAFLDGDLYFLNRALIVDGAGIPITISKGPLTRIRVSVIFNLFRG